MNISNKDIGDKMNNSQISRIISWIIFAITPLVMYFLMEVFNARVFNIKFREISIFYIFLNLVILYMILMFGFVLTNRTKIASVIVELIVMVFTIANYFVYKFRGTPIVASDIYSIRTAANVAGDYEFDMPKSLVKFIVLAVVFIMITLIPKGFKVMSQIKIRIGALVAYICAAIVFVNVFVLSDQLSDWGINVKLYRPHKSYRLYGTVLTTVRTIGYIIVEEPDGYTVEEVEDVNNQYAKSMDSDNTKVKPNIIAIMDEAFSDLITSYDLDTNEDNMPFIRSLEDNVIKGNVYVSSFGGNTANCEFEFLTGNSMAFLPTNSVPYQLFIKDTFPNLTSWLKAQGYNGNYAMHPYYASGYNRVNIYNHFGFERFVTIDDFENPWVLRERITDQDDFDKIIELYEHTKSKSDAPFYMFNVTMQNHSGYAWTDDNMEKRITIENESQKNTGAEVYLNLVKYTDDAVRNLIEYFSNVEEPTVIIFFGDHQPGINEKWYSDVIGENVEDIDNELLMKKMYNTPYFAWANYDIEEETKDISLNYLASYIMEKTGVELTNYQKYILDVQKQVPIITSLGYYGNDGRFYDLDDTQSPYFDIVNQYRYIQYNNIHDVDNRVDEMFWLEK